MARQWRIEYKGAYITFYPGGTKKNIFFDDDDRICFLETLGQMANRFEIEIYAYVLLENHYLR